MDYKVVVGNLVIKGIGKVQRGQILEDFDEKEAAKYGVQLEPVREAKKAPAKKAPAKKAPTK